MPCTALFLSILLWGFLFEFTTGCHYRETKYNYQNFKGCGGEQGDTIGNDPTLPPGITPEPKITTTTTTTTTTTSTATTTTIGETVGPPRLPVGDCPCGNGIDQMDKSQGGTENLNRPWLVQITVTTKIECTGSLLNRRWIISAAHCFCDSQFNCTRNEPRLEKVFESRDHETLGNIVLRFGTHQDISKRPKIFGVEKLVIHPNYDYELSADTDVALLKVGEDIFGMNFYGNETDQFPWVVPICLPPKLNFHPNKNQADKGIHEAFEDMDCHLIPENKKVLYPYTKVKINTNWLACHPVQFSKAEKINIQGRSSFITAFSSTARKDDDEGVSCQYATNSYGPLDSIFEYCQSNNCHKKDDLMPQSDRLFGNPSLADPICSQFRKEIRKEALQAHQNEMEGSMLTEQGDNLDMMDNFLGWVKIRIKSTGKEVLCFPHLYKEGLEDARSMWDFPYRHGWCKVCEKGITGDCVASPTPTPRWGWCQPPCDDPPLQPHGHHETAVDAFVYENCSMSINTSTEFCTRPPILSGYGQVWEWNDSPEGTFKRIKSELIKYHEEIQENGKSIIKPGSMYEAIPHKNAPRDACYGDVGGSVWKFWVFRDESSVPDNRVYKLAVITGVVSRFEEHCGVFRPDITKHSSKPVQHTTHTRVTSILDWINKWIADGKCEMSCKERIDTYQQGKQVPGCEWGYQESDDSLGPNRWHEWWKACSGDRQSPIDIPQGDNLKSLTPENQPADQYNQLKFEGYDKYTFGNLFDNGHSLYFEDRNDSVKHTLSGVPNTGENKFHLHQLHWHWGEEDDKGSEHSVGGTKYPMELHLVHVATEDHNDTTQDDYRFVVLAFFYEVSVTRNTGLDKLLIYIKEIADEGTEGIDHVIKPFHAVRISDFLPLDMKPQKYYFYKGSFTTPPCTENVAWVVFNQTEPISSEQLAVFRRLRNKEGKSLAGNFRDRQPLNGREVYKNF